MAKSKSSSIPKPTPTPSRSRDVRAEATDNGAVSLQTDAEITMDLVEVLLAVQRSFDVEFQRIADIQAELDRVEQRQRVGGN